MIPSDRLQMISWTGFATSNDNRGMADELMVARACVASLRAVLEHNPETRCRATAEFALKQYDDKTREAA